MDGVPLLLLSQAEPRAHLRANRPPHLVKGRLEDCKTSVSQERSDFIEAGILADGFGPLIRAALRWTSLYVVVDRNVVKTSEYRFAPYIAGQRFCSDLYFLLFSHAVVMSWLLVEVSLLNYLKDILGVVRTVV